MSNLSHNENDCFTDHRIARAVAKFNELSTVLCDTNVNIQTRRKTLGTCVKSRVIYGTAAWFPNEHQLKKMEACWTQCLRSMVKGGWGRRNVPDSSEDGEEHEVDYGFVYTNKQIQQIIRTVSLRSFIYSQYLKYIAHVWRDQNTSLTKILLYAKTERSYYQDPWIKIAALLAVSTDQTKRLTQSRKEFAELILRRFSSTP